MPGYSQAILTGLNRRGMTDEQVRQVLAISTSRFSFLRSGRFELSDREVVRVEEASGRTGGQLALQGSDFSDDFGLSNTLDQWADLVKPGQNLRVAKSRRGA